MHLQKTRYISVIALAALVLAACNQRPEEHENAANGSTANPAAAISAPKATTPARAQVTLDPSGLPACTPPAAAVVTIGWQVTDPAVTTVDVKVLAGDGREDLFANGGAQGSKETGPWMLPGSTAVVRDQATGVELGRASVESLPCTK